MSSSLKWSQRTAMCNHNPTVTGRLASNPQIASTCMIMRRYPLAGVESSRHTCPVIVACFNVQNPIDMMAPTAKAAASPPHRHAKNTTMVAVEGRDSNSNVLEAWMAGKRLSTVRATNLPAITEAVGTPKSSEKTTAAT